ncbi:Dimeric alpha-beta barrel [Niveomyces insectorum RCEF 264]|uniref:Dimeric alpha-beta barrel n=1 Tax=Niveomyces insectorum RCEF 264 TaxID=1081102 RepID=A0A167XVH3_9HYPO|nr:Dimeric alpha-beta barrel [Niveomyces insectorum RCEF 264]
MDNSMILVARLPTVNTLYQAQLLSAMTNIACNASDHEPGVRQFALLVPHNKTTSTAVYAIERYANHAAFQSHLQTAAVRDMFAWINATPIYGDNPPVVHQLSPLNSGPDDASVKPSSSSGQASAKNPFEYVSPALATTPNPFVVVRQFDYAGGADAAQASLPTWEQTVAAKIAGVNIDDGANGTGVLSYGVFGGVDHAERIFTITAYADEAAYQKDLKSRTDERDVDEAEPLLLQLRGGFLSRA